MIKNVELVPGHIKITDDGNKSYLIKITDVLRAADVPNLGINSLSLLTQLAEVVLVIVKALVDREILDEDLNGSLDFQEVHDRLVTDMAADSNI